MKNYYDQVQLEDCPVCGKKEGAYQGNSAWGHNVMCCSNECGEEMKNRLDALRKTPEMVKALDEFHVVRQRILSMLKEVTKVHSHFEMERWVH